MMVTAQRARSVPGRLELVEQREHRKSWDTFSKEKNRPDEDASRRSFGGGFPAPKMR